MKSVDLSVLIRRGVCSGDDGKPILYKASLSHINGRIYLSICVTCLTAIKHHRLPRRALANGLWIGDIPPPLQALSFVEKILVAKYRHNACVVEVHQGNGAPGQRKMRANTVIFPQPIDKVYTVLPPPRDDLDDVLAILFVGPCVPTEADYRRTPLLVRHRVVSRALEWLVPNNREYADVVISPDNLASYGESEPPVGV
ncbi:hypothetical protein FOMPIDRAFT_1128451 [Fomitopsis schrenkii]|uniref:DUF6570 domain-containing protein n=1 Tax=Fomitopsis schrenkii TaxID=2126942 RepID=S8DXN5_FOMSC|nr:hypothetical protein FOMPIDRAFT_1128451 [Fomitopsis schrenkii]